MIPEMPETRGSRKGFLSLFVPFSGVNTLASALIAFPMLKTLTGEAPAIYGALHTLAFLSHFFLLNLLVGILAFGVSLLLPRRTASGVLVGFFSLFQTGLLIDAKIYSMFRYHINALVLNVLTTEGAGDSVFVGKGTFVSFAGLIAVIVVAEVSLALFLGRSGRPALLTDSLIRRASKVCLIAGLCMVAGDKAIYAYGDLVNNTSITGIARVFPLYQPLTIKRFAMNVLHIRVNREEGIRVQAKTGRLAYPRAPLRFDPTRERSPNIILIVLDGLRYDMLNEETMPNLWKFGAENVRFENHFSGGNGTRFGIFTLLYGVHGSYWHSFLAHRVSPVLMDTLLAKGYELEILSSTLLTFPEFRKTAFVRTPESIKDSFPSESITGKDELMTEEFLRFLSSRSPQKPFFAFLYYNSSHQAFYHPPAFTKFQPVSSDEINYFKDIGRSKIDLLKNRYRNSLFYEDFLVGKVLASVEKQGLLGDSIIIVTGDHGEEFYESGFFGHTSAFNDYQLKTAFVLHFPGEERKTISRMTSHLDVVPTLLQSLGCVSPHEEYSQGFPLLENQRHPYVMAANWDTAAIIDVETVIAFSTESYNMGALEVRRRDDYTPAPDQRRVLKEKRAALMDAALKMSEFYK